MSWKIPKIWGGCDAWILGGGPSLTSQFGIPDTIVKQVQNGVLPPSTYSSYMSELHNKHVIGVNMAYKIGTWIDIVIFGDKTFFLNEKSGLYDFPGLKVSLCPDQRSDPFVKYVIRDTEHIKGISQDPRRLSWNHNTGAAAINLAAHLGAKRIILLGFDMKMSNNMCHWHNLYRKGPANNPEKIRKALTTFDRHLSSFPVIAEDAKRLGIEIINACPDSAITCFPRITVKEILG